MNRQPELVDESAGPGGDTRANIIYEKLLCTDGIRELRNTLLNYTVLTVKPPCIFLCKSDEFLYQLPAPPHDNEVNSANKRFQRTVLRVATEPER